MNTEKYEEVSPATTEVAKKFPESDDFPKFGEARNKSEKSEKICNPMVFNKLIYVQHQNQQTTITIKNSTCQTL